MSADYESASQALAIAHAKLDAGDLDAALRFCKKSISLGSTSQATDLLAKITQIQKNGAHKPPVNNAARPAPKESPPTPPKREFSSEQAALVKRIQSCKVTAYYEILAVERDCNESAVKSAYRKIAVKVHPDKCGAPGAEEAFKRVSKAFTVLSDSDKRAAYDRHGDDPESKTAGMSTSSPFSNMRQRGGQQNYYSQNEMTPDEIFRAFFGGGSPFGPNVQTFSFGGPGMGQFATHRTFSSRPRAQQSQHANNSSETSTLVQILPLLMMFGFWLLSQIPSLVSGGYVADPHFGFEQNQYYDTKLSTHSRHNVDYFVNSKQFSTHPIYKTVLQNNPIPDLDLKPSGKPHEKAQALRESLTQATYLFDPTAFSTFKLPKTLKRFESTVEDTYVETLRETCVRQLQHRRDQISRAQGFFGVGKDEETLKKWKDTRYEACDIMQHKFGYNVGY